MGPRILIVAAVLSGPATLAAVQLLAATGFVLLPGAAPRFSGPQGREKDYTEILATREQTGGSLGMFRQEIAPSSSGPPLHVHRAEDEFIFVLSGNFSVRIGDRTMNAPSQSLMFVPRGTAHAFQNVGSGPGVLLVGVTPGGFEKFFQERQGVDADMQRALMKTHNMEVVGPPLK